MRISAILRDIVQYLCSIRRYVSRQRLFWTIILVLLVAVIVPFWFASEAAFRRTGLVLQLLGIGTVVWNIESTRIRNGLGTSLAAALQVIRERPRFRRRIDIGTIGGMSASETKATGRLVGWHTPPTDASLEVRIASIEKNLSIVKDQLSTLFRIYGDVLRCKNFAV